MPCRLFQLFFPLLCTAILFSASTLAEEPAASPSGKSAKRQAIQVSLLKQIDWNFEETPLAEVVQSLQQELQIQIQLDRQAIAELGVSPDTKVTLKIAGISAKSAWNILLRDLGLKYIIRDKVLIITSPDKAASNLLAISYDVTDIAPSEKGSKENEDDSFDSFLDMILGAVMPATWDRVGGPGSIKPSRSPGKTTIRISQADEVHEHLAKLFADLQALRHPAKNSKSADSASPAASVEQATRAADEKIRKILSKPVALNFNNASLTEVLSSLEEQIGQKIRRDTKAIMAGMNTSGAETDLRGSPANMVEKKLSQIKIPHLQTNSDLATALDIALKSTNLSWAVWDESIWITTSEEASSRLVTRIYDLSGMPPLSDKFGKKFPNDQAIVDNITQTVSPTSWDIVGGPCSIRSIKYNGIRALVVSQTWNVHKQLDTQFDASRRLNKKPASKAKTPPAKEQSPPADGK